MTPELTRKLIEHVAVLGEGRKKTMEYTEKKSLLSAPFMKQLVKQAFQDWLGHSPDAGDTGHHTNVHEITLSRNPHCVPRGVSLQSNTEVTG